MSIVGDESSPHPEIPRDVEVKLSEVQVEQVLSAIAPRRGGFTLDDLTKIFNLIALLATAAWALHEYFNFQKESQELELRRRKFEVEQQQVSARLLSLDETIKTTEANFASETPLKFNIETTIDKIGRQGKLIIYWVQLRIGAHNQSKNPINISSVQLKFFIGHLSNARQPNEVIRLRGPRLANDAINWRQVLHTQYYSDSGDEAVNAAHKEAGDVLACPAFGRVVYGDELGECGLDFRVVASPDDFIGITEDFVVQQTSNAALPYEFDQWRELKYQGRQAMSGAPITN